MFKPAVLGTRPYVGLHLKGELMSNELGLHPVPDLLPEGQDSPEQQAVRRKAALAVASRATSVDDCAKLLDMLGLHESSGRSSEVA